MKSLALHVNSLPEDNSHEILRHMISIKLNICPGYIKGLIETILFSIQNICSIQSIRNIVLQRNIFSTWNKKMYFNPL